MSIFRVEKTKNYTVMSNHHLRDKNLSLKSIGLLSLILSLPDNWNYSQAGLAAICKDGEDSIRNGLKELEQYGYLVRERERDEKGKMKRMVYHIYEVPGGSAAPQNATSNDSNSRSRIAASRRKDALKASHNAYTKTDDPGLKNPSCDIPTLAKNEQLITNKSIKDKPNIEKRMNPSTNLSIEKVDGNERYDCCIQREELRSMIRKNIGYDLFVFKQRAIESKLDQGLIDIHQYDQAMSEHNTKTLDRVIEYVLDVLTSINTEPIKIGNELIDRGVVKSKLLSCGIQAVKRVVLELNTNPAIRNPKKYSISMLYNA
jgi:hypothetical protein